MWSGSSPLTVVRNGMWALLLCTGVTWLAIGWTVLRLGPADVVRVGGAVLIFAAAAEAVRALAKAKAWWLNAGLTVLFALTGAVLLTGNDSSFATPAALVGWYLVVRGAADIAVSMMVRETDRTWGMLMVAGVLETGLGFFASGPFGRTGELLVVVLGALGLCRGIVDLVAALRLHELSAFRAEILNLPSERAVGLTGYSAGHLDFETGHTGTPAGSTPAGSTPAGSTPADGTPAGSTPADDASAASTPAAGTPAASTPSDDTGADSFHQEVLRTTADLDAMLAMAGLTAPAPDAHTGDVDLPPVPDTPEGVDQGETIPQTTPARETDQTSRARHRAPEAADDEADATRPEPDETSLTARDRRAD
ncbi:hypothetical protein GCM10012284_01130 [Mangrovihabitans endophyticus]|uniref:DUF308 domain-containing protein n=1 Tax=Mangrovihabitans endophyticus TaxID=1751298 RepID=A0A8J3FLR3_9ACTN|nr:hypothetical protein GCM10012284_01130 [Mangrovihabitans endophyticus]